VKPIVVDLGIRFEDIATWKIVDESVSDEDDWRPLLHELGSSSEEIGYLVAETWRVPSERKHRRGKVVTHWHGWHAELNGLIGQNFIDFIEAKLDALEIGKLIPEDGWLEQAYVRAVKVKRRTMRSPSWTIGTEEKEVVVPGDLRQRVEVKLAVNRARVWDLIAADLAEADTA
jgi:hypothetical protein